MNDMNLLSTMTALGFNLIIEREADKKQVEIDGMEGHTTCQSILEAWIEMMAVPLDA